MISRKLYNKLLQISQFRDFIDDHKKDQTTANSSMDRLKKLSSHIIRSIDKKIKAHDELADFIAEGDEKFAKQYREGLKFDNRTLGDTLNKDSETSPTDPRRRRMVNVLMAYAGLDHDLWREFRKEDQTPDAIHEALPGLYYIYRYDKNVLKRTVLEIYEGPVYELRATYRSLHDSQHPNGKVSIHKSILTITFSETKSIDITAYVDDDILNSGKMLNGIIRSTTDVPYAVQCIIVGFNKSADFDLKKEKATTVYHSSEQPANPNEPHEKSDGALDPLIVFLSRKMKGIHVKKFDDNTPEGLRKRNNPSADKTNLYNHYKKILEGDWISIANKKIPGFVIDKWKFTFDNRTETCVASGTSGHLNFAGFAEFTDELITIDINVNDHSPAKRLVINSIVDGSPVENIKLRGVSLLSWNEAYGGTVSFREILVRSSDPELLKKSKISYSSFLELPILTDEEKIYLLKDHPIHNSGTIQRSLIDIQKHISIYKGNYYLFFPNMYDEGKEWLFQSTLNIDPIAKANGQIFIDTQTRGKANKVIKYHGSAILHEQSLRVTIESLEHKRGEYLFSVSENATEAPILMQGITLDTDKNNRPCADIVVAVNKLHLDEYWAGKFSGESKVIRDTDPEYNYLNTLLLEQIKIPLKKYFFQDYKSIRFKKQS